MKVEVVWVPILVIGDSLSTMSLLVYRQKQIYSIDWWTQWEPSALHEVYIHVSGTCLVWDYYYFMICHDNERDSVAPDLSLDWLGLIFHWIGNSSKLALSDLWSDWLRIILHHLVGSSFSAPPLNPTYSNEMFNPSSCQMCESVGTASGFIRTSARF